MKEIGSREFQISYQKLKEPVKVVAKSGPQKTIGYFYPGELPPGLEQDILFSPDKPAAPEADDLETIL